uniref:Uncharacterized protein n=1 Tax=Parascaris equorum TaxID=6256 RepID=A0A914RP48_PAREQ
MCAGLSACPVISSRTRAVYIYALRYLNDYRRRAVRKWNSQSGLSIRYQLDENIRALNLVVPLICLQFIFNFTTAVMVYVIVAVEDDLDAVTYSIYDRLNGVLTLYPIALLILLFFKDPSMIAHFRKNFPQIRELSKVNPSVAVITNIGVNNISTPQFVIAENTNARFDQLKELFEANPKYEK